MQKRCPDRGTGPLRDKRPRLAETVLSAWGLYNLLSVTETLGVINGMKWFSWLGLVSLFVLTSTFGVAESKKSAKEITVAAAADLSTAMQEASRGL